MTPAQKRALEWLPADGYCWRYRLTAKGVAERERIFGPPAAPSAELEQ